MESLLVAMRFGQFVAVMILFGSSLFPIYALPRHERDSPFAAELIRFLNRVATGATVLALLSALGWLGCEAVLMSANPRGYSDRGVLSTVLGSTQFGHIWKWRLGILTALASYLAIRAATGMRPRVMPLLIAGAALVVTLAGIGHGAMGMGYDEWLHLGSQAIHLLAGATWVGGLLALLYMVRQFRRGGVRLETVSCALHRFSLAGMAAVLFILASGSLNAWFLVGSFHALFHTSYGRVLLIKISFFLAMIGLALFNRLYLMPRLAAQIDPAASARYLGRSIAVEQICAVCVVAAVSILGNMMPAFDMPGM